MPTNEKIALFCRFYEKHVNVKYKVSPFDAGKMKHTQLNEQFLQHYFATPMFQIKNKYSVSNLVRYYNELLAEIAHKGKPQLPNSWSQDFVSRLNGTELSAYYAHLRRLGLKPK